MEDAERAARRAARHAFARANRFALFLNTGAADYGAARCCLLNIEVSGFQLGAQAIEKTMKGILLLLDPTFDPKKASHGLKGLNERLRQLGSPAAVASDDSIDRFMKHYNDRYPREDGSTEVEAFSPAEIVELDNIMIHLVTNEPDVPTRYRCGVGARLSVFAASGKPDKFGRDRWLLPDNAALERVKTDLIPLINEA